MGRPPGADNQARGPPGVPSVLLERRSDSTERRIAEQMALIGVAVVAYFPDILLCGYFGWAGP
jgi:outer membrane protein TolC